MIWPDKSEPRRSFLLARLPRRIQRVEPDAESDGDSGTGSGLYSSVNGSEDGGFCFDGHSYRHV